MLKFENSYFYTRNSFIFKTADLDRKGHQTIVDLLEWSYHFPGYHWLLFWQIHLHHVKHQPFKSALYNVMLNRLKPSNLLKDWEH